MKNKELAELLLKRPDEEVVIQYEQQPNCGCYEAGVRCYCPLEDHVAIKFDIDQAKIRKGSEIIKTYTTLSFQNTIQPFEKYNDTDKRVFVDFLLSQEKSDLATKLKEIVGL
jgi:hypothetical protein